MLNGSRLGVCRRVQPISIHGQIFLDVYFSDPEEPDGQTSVARVGSEAVPRHLEPGDRIHLHYLMGVVTGVTKDLP